VDLLERRQGEVRLDYERLQALLKSRRRHAYPLEGRTPSGVTIPLFDREGETHVLFTLRTQKVKHHKGQISFPGGASEAGDGNILETAIRETVEEVGIPVSHIRVLGAFDDVVTISGFHVTPVVVRLDWPFPIHPCEDEIQEVIEIPLGALTAPGVPRIEQWDWEGGQVEMYFYDHGEHTVWGATGRMLRQFLEVAKNAVA
jgi:8-oxo-dGTP pyrophosphatase MutT (NUDIX family)